MTVSDLLGDEVELLALAIRHLDLEVERLGGGRVEPFLLPLEHDLRNLLNSCQQSPQPVSNPRKLSILCQQSLKATDFVSAISETGQFRVSNIHIEVEGLGGGRVEPLLLPLEHDLRNLESSVSLRKIESMKVSSHESTTLRYGGVAATSAGRWPN